MSLPGGWTAVDPLGNEAQEAARFAVQAYAVAQHRRVLYQELIEAQQQVVSGVNFQLQLQVQEDKKMRSVQATVWRQLSGTYQLTEWVWLD